MNNLKCTNGIHCQRRLITNVICLLFFIVFGSILGFFMMKNILDGKNTTLLSDLVNFAPFLIFFLIGLASSPKNLIICDEGIYIETLWLKKYLEWKDINWGKQDGYHTVISANHLTIFHWLLGILLLEFKPIFTLSKTSHQNYKQALERLQLKNIIPFHNT